MPKRHVGRPKKIHHKKKHVAMKHKKITILLK